MHDPKDLRLFHLVFFNGLPITVMYKTQKVPELDPW